MRRTSLFAALLGLSASIHTCLAAFVQLNPISSPEIRESSPPYSEPQYSVAHLLDGKAQTEFASKSLGTNTVVEFALPQPTRIGAIRHVDRDDPATIAESQLDFLDTGGAVIGSIHVSHVQKPKGETFLVLPHPVSADRIRWRITRLGNPTLPAVGGAELSFFAIGSESPMPAADKVDVKISPFVDKHAQRTLSLLVEHPYREPAEVYVKLQTGDLGQITIKPGKNELEFQVPDTTSPGRNKLTLEYAGKAIAAAEFEQRPVRRMTIYVTPHSHTDIGYTEIQTAIERKQVQNLRDGIAAARRTAGYPEGARFVWNVEVGWAADLYLQRLDAAQREEFLQAVRAGQVVLNGMYLNELTGLCRPEELIQLFRFATELSTKTGVPIDTAMISDVPGYTWGTVTAMAQAGVKYFSTAPNYFDRIGTILREWENKPFYWAGPDGKSKVLVWIPFWGYAMSHKYHAMSPRLVADLYDGLEKREYPFDVAYVRWSGHGDNAVPDPSICEFVRDWNEKYAWPRFVISGASEAFHAFEARYGHQLPVVRGDWSPYWEDGAGSSALETSLNRNTADRLSAAATLFALLKPAEYPKTAFEDAWRNTLLYSEHTWGAWCSVSEPERKDTLEQWAIKKSYADKAAAATGHLLEMALKSESTMDRVEILNSLSWERTEIVRVSAELSKAGDRVLNAQGKAVPSQRLRSGELAFLAEKVPPLGGAIYMIASGAAMAPKHAVRAGDGVLANGLVEVRVDKRTGGIQTLKIDGIKEDFVDNREGEALGDYLYLIGDDPKCVQKSGESKISVGESGPLLSSILVDSPAPGARHLQREIILGAAQDSIEFHNRVDKSRLQVGDYRSREGKECINFAFPFAVPEGDLLADIPLGAFRPEVDQMPSACKNWLTIGRWVEVANRNRGVTWVSIDAPLIEVGELSATLLNSQTDPEVWRKHIPRSQRLYSWAMNNHWGTNYRAYQDGPVAFRYVIRAHRGNANPAEATRFATRFTTPLWIRRATPDAATRSLLHLSNPDVVLISLKPSDDGKALVARLFGASGKDSTTKIQWLARKPSGVFMSDTSEKAGAAAGREIAVPGYGVVTLRAELE